MARLLPLLHQRGSRSSMTCQFRCGNACAHAVPNQSDNEYFGDIAQRALSRRSLLAASGAGALVLATGGSSAADTSGAALPSGSGSAGQIGLDFDPVPPNTLDALTTAAGYQQSVVVRWGDPVYPDAPPFDFDNQTHEAQARQFGLNCDYTALLPLRTYGRGERGLLVVNNEYTNDRLMFRGWTTPDNATVEQVKISLTAHGLSVVEVERVGSTGQWRLVRTGRRPYNRRITASTPTVLTGPAAGHAMLKTAADPSGRKALGTYNNCSGGITPWGTTLHGEENFNVYFDASGPVDPSHAEAFTRYGIPVAKFTNRAWSKAEERFDVAKHPNEANRHGWIVELDPYNPSAPPRKHTMLGRFKHEGANTRLTADGRVAAYMGDDERFDYQYKFVSKDRYRPSAGSRNSSVLDRGTLYVARFLGDGTGDNEYDGLGEWIQLTSDTESFVPGMSVAEVLINTRLAADKVGATKMDRPEDVEPNPVTGTVYMVCTNNTRRTPAQVDEANPRPNNKDGHVIEIDEDRNDAGSTLFRWRIFLVCGDPSDPSTFFGGYDKSKVSPISCPDNVAFDRDGNLWIATDGNALGSNDGLFVTPVRGSERGHVKQFLTVPVGAETCGPVITRDNRTVFVAVQHPGEEDGATPENPASHWPDGGSSQPLPSVVCVWRA